MAKVDWLGPSKDHGLMHGVLKLPHVSRKSMPLESFEGAFCDARSRVRPCETANKRRNKQGQVCGTFSQWGHDHLQHLETIVQVLPEQPLRNAIFETPVSRREKRKSISSG